MTGSVVLSSSSSSEILLAETGGVRVCVCVYMYVSV